MIPKFWLRFVALLALWLGTAGVTLTSLATVPYDGQWPISVAYDSHASHATCGFDEAGVQPAGGNCRESAASSPRSTIFLKFLAAEETVTLYRGVKGVS